MRLHPTIPTAVLSIALLGACATPAPVTAPPGTSSPAASAALPTPSEDTCSAANYAPFVGADYRQVPSAPQGRVFRVACTTCAMTKDYSAQRLNFFYDATTGKVVRLTCG